MACREINFTAGRTSPEIQNEILNIASDLVVKDISKAVEEAGKFSIIVDETADVSNMEQVSACVFALYSNNNNNNKAFVNFQQAVQRRCTLNIIIMIGILTLSSITVTNNQILTNYDV